jgi:tetratricopeptide (TPR) repeat protein
MKQLRAIITTLRKDELARLRMLELKGKQQLVLTGLLDEKELGAKHITARSLGLSDAHYHEIGTKLLQKVYDALAPDGLINLCIVLNGKNLSKLLYQELQRLEKQISRSGSRTEMETFYLTAFEFSLNETVKDRNFDLAHKFGKLYLTNKPHHTIGDEQYVELRTLRALVGETYNGKTLNRSDVADVHMRIEAAGLEAKKHNHKPAIYQLSMALVEFYSFLDRSPHNVLANLHQAIDTVDSLPEFLAREERSRLEIWMADAQYMLGNYETAYRLYQLFFTTIPKEREAVNEPYFALRYAELAAILGNFDHALRIIEERVLSVVNQSPPLVASQSVRLAVIYILQEKYPDALREIQTGYSANQGRSYSLMQDMRLRFLETSCAYLAGEWEYATVLINRALQFLRSKKRGLSDSDEGKYFKYIYALMLKKEEGLAIAGALVEHYQKYTVAPFRFFGMVLEKVGNEG